MTAGDNRPGALTYAGSGVDIDAADDARERIRRLVESTRTKGVAGAFGSFGGMFQAPGAPGKVLVASADGVGTKLRVAIEAGRYDTVGHCLVNHCVNDILALGAEPLFFLDYVAFGRLRPELVEGVVAGVVAGCRENGCALLGGETAEMPGIYAGDDFDLAGFIVGVVDDRRRLGPGRVREGDVLLALASSGLHTNGYSLARRIVSERMKLAAADRFPGAGGATVADVLLRVHRSYLAALKPSLDRIHAMAHITGGGLPGNLGRALPDTLDAEVETGSWAVPDVFSQLGTAGGVSDGELFRTFNMGVGAVVVVDPADVGVVSAGCAEAGVETWNLGVVVRGSGQVHLAGVT
ncbi:MAG: phosphoribosylformylglycinamidine cyclo-ligase [Gemmatimonadota bacterium]